MKDSGINTERKLKKSTVVKKGRRDFVAFEICGFGNPEFSVLTKVPGTLFASLRPPWSRPDWGQRGRRLRSEMDGAGGRGKW